MATKSKNFSQQLTEYFGTDETTHTHNLVALRNYFGVGNKPEYDGSYFETFELNSENVNHIVAADLVAVTLLSMEIKRKSRSGISTSNAIMLAARSGEIAEILTQIPIDKELHTLSSAEFSQLIGEGSLGARLWHLLRDIENGIGMHRVATYKLIARKRPHLYPIEDSRTRKILGNQKNWWTSWYEALVESPEVVAELGNLRSELAKDVPKARDISLLRIADIALWQD